MKFWWDKTLTNFEIHFLQHTNIYRFKKWHSLQPYHLQYPLLHINTIDSGIRNNLLHSLYRADAYLERA